MGWERYMVLGWVVRRDVLLLGIVCMWVLACQKEDLLSYLPSISLVHPPLDFCSYPFSNLFCAFSLVSSCYPLIFLIPLFLLLFSLYALPCYTWIFLLSIFIFLPSFSFHLLPSPFPSPWYPLVILEFSWSLFLLLVIPFIFFPSPFPSPCMLLLSLNFLDPFSSSLLSLSFLLLFLLLVSLCYHSPISCESFSFFASSFSLNLSSLLSFSSSYPFLSTSNLFSQKETNFFILMGNNFSSSGGRNPFWII